MHVSLSWKRPIWEISGSKNFVHGGVGSSRYTVNRHGRDNDYHRRSVAASLVSGVYTLERDRQEKCDSKQALAPPWWEFFHFRMIRPLVDDADNSIFGAIYEFEPKTSQLSKSGKGSPRYVIAFRARSSCNTFGKEYDDDGKVS
ncbi:GDSL esterase/lipase-like protein [Drosera capensis]